MWDRTKNQEYGVHTEITQYDIIYIKIKQKKAQKRKPTAKMSFTWIFLEIKTNNDESNESDIPFGGQYFYSNKQNEKKNYFLFRKQSTLNCGNFVNIMHQVTLHKKNVYRLLISITTILKFAPFLRGGGVKFYLLSFWAIFSY